MFSLCSIVNARYSETNLLEFMFNTSSLRTLKEIYHKSCFPINQLHICDGAGKLLLHCSVKSTPGVEYLIKPYKNKEKRKLLSNREEQTEEKEDTKESVLSFVMPQSIRYIISSSAKIMSLLTEVTLFEKVQKVPQEIMFQRHKAFLTFKIK